MQISFDSQVGGTVEIGRCAFVNEGSQPFTGTSNCVTPTLVKVLPPTYAAPAPAAQADQESAATSS
ncbi:hypothetical protein ACIRRH_42245 [Kitasatospora sp. NPDC101235]|uniref:hypothetical protein n=1 Tax=Kitasatospora sp. NPDC101235 TaxID=3364101 RepID=UPI0037F635E2